MTLDELYRELDAIPAPDWTPGAPFREVQEVVARVQTSLRAYDPALAAAAEGLLHLGPGELEALLAEAFAGGLGDRPEPERFVLLAALRAYARGLAREAEGDGARCPVCGGQADAAYLDEDGGRHLVCAVCDSRWAVPRIACPYCGEADPKKLRYYPYDPHYRLYQCLTCGATLPAVDLREAGRLDLPALRAAGVEMRFLLEAGRVEG